MSLDELNKLVGRLKMRIEQHKNVLGKNEIATRYALIDPLLTALGWDLSDPGQVRTEYHTGEGRADYAMLSGGSASRPRLVIEAKKLDSPLSNALSQSITYSNEKGIPYSVVTNGRDWAAYDIFKAVPNEDKKIVDFSLTDPTQPTVMKMLWLWRGNFESGSPMVPVVPDRPAPQQTVTPAPQPAAAESSASVEQPNQGIPFDKFNPRIGDPRPAALRFPDGTEKRIANWYEIQTSVVEWLVDTDRLTEADCPVKGPKDGSLVTTAAEHQQTKKIEHPKIKGNLFIHRDKDAPSHVNAAKEILRARCVDLSDVRVVMKT